MTGRFARLAEQGRPTVNKPLPMMIIEEPS